MTTATALLASTLTLPRALAGPLSYPGPEIAWGRILPATLALISLALLWWWHRRRRPAAAPLPQPTGVSGTIVGSAADEIRELRDRHLRRRTYRKGCHQLSALLREHFERVGFGARRRVRCTRLTSPEIAQRLGDGGASKLFLDLARLQWNEAGPDRNAFRTICSRATQTVSREAEA